MLNLYTSMLLLGLAGDAEKPKPVFPLGKATTYITEPLDKDGYIDYEAALNARLGKGVRPEKNANVLLWKAVGPRPEGIRMSAEYYKYLGIEEPPEKGDYFLSLDAYLPEPTKSRWGKIETFWKHHKRAGKRPWSAKDYPQLAKWLQINEKPLAVVLEATKRTEYFNPLVSSRTPKQPKYLLYSELSNLYVCQEMGKALACRALLRIHEKKFPAAWQDLLACHRLGRLVAKGGMPIEFMLGLEIEVWAAQAELAYLDHAPLSTKQLQTRLEDLQDVPPLSPLADKVDLGDRFMFLDTLQLLRRDGIEVDWEGGMKKPDPKLLKLMESLDWEPLLRDGNRWWNRIVGALRLEDRSERVETLDEIGTTLIRRIIENTERKNQTILFFWKPSRKAVAKEVADRILSGIATGNRKVQDDADRAEQRQRNLHVAFALAMYHRDHGSYPKKLDALTPKYLAKVLDDLFSEEALHYRPQAKGYLLYSVGVNTQDDQGQGYEDDPGGDDLAIRIPRGEK